MISVTGHKQFKHCPRQWCYQNIVADGRVKKDSFRREVTLLSKLQTIYSWRGTIVDRILSRYLVNAINKKMPIQKDFFLNQAMAMFNTQLEYAVLQKYKESNAIITEENQEFNALFEYELGNGVSDEEISAAKEDLVVALSNVLDDTGFINYLRSASNIISQRRLVYYFDRFSVVAKPDLIAFFEDQPPHIFDWKVHTYGNVSYDEQLVAYAVALYKVGITKPHEDFPGNLANYRIYDYKLSEYQLLHQDRIKRDYVVTPEQIEEFGEDLSSAIIEMHMAGTNKKYANIDVEDFPTTEYIENCISCPFQKICKNGKNAIKSQEVRDKYFQY